VYVCVHVMSISVARAEKYRLNAANPQTAAAAVAAAIATGAETRVGHGLGLPMVETDISKVGLPYLYTNQTIITNLGFSRH